jgi:hypothetical protein
VTDVIEVSYTGDLLAHRRCGRAWAYEKHAGFHPYEVVQAMEGRLVHHAMEWLTRQYQDIHQRQRHSRPDELREQLEHYFRVLWARGIRTAFVSKKVTLDRVMENLYPGGVIDPIVKTVVEGAQHTEYELRAVKKVLPADYGGKSRILLTGILDLVIQQQAALTYEQTWEWESMADLTGHALPASSPPPQATSRSGTTRVPGQRPVTSMTTSANSSHTPPCIETGPAHSPRAASCSS